MAVLRSDSVYPDEEVVEEAKELSTVPARSGPLRDEKVLAAWNGLMIGAHARAALVLGDDRYATRAAEFILTAMRSREGLLRSFMDG